MDAAAVAAALAGLAPSGVRTGVRPVDAADLALLRPGEAGGGARPGRASGRALLRELLGSAAAIPVGGRGEPVGPAGFRLTLAHDAGLAVAAIAPDGAADALGVDVEPTGQLDAQEGTAVLRDDDPPIDPTLALVLKEAAYKAWSGLGGGLVDFGDALLVAVDPPGFSVRFPGPTTITGRFAEAGGRWVALAVVGAGQVRGPLPRASS